MKVIKMASYEKSKSSGLWSVRFRIIEDGQEKNKRLSGYPKKSEAEKAYREYVAQDARKVRESKRYNDLLFKDVYETYYENAKKRLKESTLYDTESMARLYVLPTFGERKIVEIEPIEILQWQNGIDKSYKYLCKIRGVMLAVFKFAEKYYKIPSPMKDVDSPVDQEDAKEMLFWTEGEFKKFISFIDDQKYRTLFLFLYFSGCRIGEALALHKNDIDTKNYLVSISKSISKKGVPVWYETTPKNKTSIRTISMPRQVIEMISQLNSDGDYVFYGNRPLPFQSVRNQLIKYSGKAEVKLIRIHDIRHSHASLMLSHNVSIVAVSKRLGHKTVTQTLNTYAHLMPRDDSMIISLNNDVISRYELGTKTE